MPVLVARPVNSETVDGVADELRRAGGRIELLQGAIADVVIMVDAARLRVALAGVLGLVSDRVAAGLISESNSATPVSSTPTAFGTQLGWAASFGSSGREICMGCFLIEFGLWS